MEYRMVIFTNVIIFTGVHQQADYSIQSNDKSVTANIITHKESPYPPETDFRGHWIGDF